MPTHRKRRKRKHLTVICLALAIGLMFLSAMAYFNSQGTREKPVILYVNQGNGLVTESNFGQMLGFASSRGFNIVFFQVYREGTLLFNRSELSYFVNQTHLQRLRIYFSLYITNSSQALPDAVMGLGEDGISLDMSSLSLATQESLLEGLAPCHCKTAVTTTDMSSPLKPDLLVLETYGPAFRQYIRPGIVASVGVFTTSSRADYKAQFQYALSNSDGVMVFDYAGLLKSGY